MLGKTPFSSPKLPTIFLKIPSLFLSNLVTFPILFNSNSYIKHASGISDGFYFPANISTPFTSHPKSRISALPS